ncbi:MAG TPA: hypothetical protein VGT44_16775 [Ktedonobacteraceae bacterium]|nr:hypothetical protein [Ktedonobacteraceae bacterium]
MQNMQTKKKPVAPAVMDIDLEDIGEEDEYYLKRTRPHTSIRRYDLPPLRDAMEEPDTETGTMIRRRRSAMKEDNQVTSGRFTSKATIPTVAKTPKIKKPASIGGQGLHIKRLPLIAVLLGMVVTAALVVSFSAISNWWQVHQDDVTYSRPRTFQIDAVVGHNDSPANPSHFIFINLNRHVVIIEMPGGDAAHARIYSGPTLFGNGQDLTPITAEFRDVNGDGKLDMIVMIQDQRLVYINTGTAFRPLQPGEQVNLPSS